METRLTPLAFSLLVLANCHASWAQAVAPRDQVPEKRAAAREAFQDDRFGLFIHWGVYSLVGKGEWLMENDKLPIPEYDRLPPRFNPTRFDADAWVKLAKSSGAKYITITAKHHDGFCMFDSLFTDYDIVDKSPYHADPLKALAGACHEQKIKLFFYYSLLDWHHPDFFPLGKTGKASGRESQGQWKRYLAYYQGQIRELCTNFGEIGGILLDGCWDRPDAEWDLAATYRMIHELQPGALIGNNRRAAPMPDEDFQILEQEPASPNAAGSHSVKITAGLPLETCVTINRSSGYDSRDKEYKSAPEIIQALVASAGRGSNLLLSIGPRPDGSMEPEAALRLHQVGTWLKTHGETVYGTRRGPIEAQSWGVSTTSGARADQKIYLHILNPKTKDPISFDPGIAWTPFLFGKTTPLKLNRKAGLLQLELPQTRLRRWIRSLCFSRSQSIVPDDRTNESEPAAPPRRAKIDRVSAAMAALTVLALFAFLWFRYGSPTRGKSVAVGDPAPLLRLIDLDSSEPLLVFGLKGKVVWIVFWSADARDAPQTLAAIARASSTIRAHRKFSMFAAAVGASKPDRVRSAGAEAGGELPVYLASAESIHRFGAEPADPPLHVLIDENGQVIAMARGAGSSTLDRLADQAKRHLDELDPHGTTRFALQRRVTSRSRAPQT